MLWDSYILSSKLKTCLAHFDQILYRKSFLVWPTSFRSSRSQSHIMANSQSASSSWCLPLLNQMTRCYIYLSDNYVLYFSCRAPSLTRGRVCNLQCNDASSISSHIATDGLLASSSWCQAPNGAHNQIIIPLFEVTSSSLCRAPSPISPMNRMIQPKVKVKSQKSKSH
jgi:hypothetical protein